MRLKKEYIYHLLLALLLFLAMFFDEERLKFRFGYLVIAVNYMIFAAIICYILVPKYYNKKKIVKFLGYTALTISLCVFSEELIIEPLIFNAPFLEELNGILFSYAHATPAIIILVGYKLLWDANQKKRELDKLKQLMVENKMQLLKSQINPHFLFNNLNNIYSYALEQSPQTPSLILELSQVLRYMLYDCKEKYVRLSDEINQLRNYIRLNKIQMGQRGEISFIADSYLEDYMIAPSILFVFVENAFKHSMASLSDNICIFIKIGIKNDRLIFRCENNLSQTSNLQDIAEGIGLNNVKTQLKLIYPETHKLTIKNDENFYAVTLHINLKKMN